MARTAVVLYVVDGGFSFARTGRAGRGRVVPLSVPPGDRKLSFSSFVEFKSPKGSGSAKPRGHWKLPVSNSPRDEAVTAHSAPDCVSTHLFGFPAGGAQIWPPLGVCRSSKYVLGMSGSRQLHGRKVDENLQVRSLVTGAFGYLTATCRRLFRKCKNQHKLLDLSNSTPISGHQ